MSSTDNNRSTVFKVALLLSGLSVTSKLIGFVREQVIAWRFGASAAVDSYVAALLVPQVVAGLIGGAVAVAFLPVYSSLKGKKEGSELSGRLVAFIATLGLLASAITILIAPSIVKGVVGNFTPEQQLLTVGMVRTMAVGMLFLGLTAFLSILFNAHRMFFLPGVAPLLMNVTIVGCLFALGNLGITGLAWFTVAGMLFSAAFLLVIGYIKGLPLFERPDFADDNFLRVMKLAGPVLVGTLFTQLYMIIDRRLASGLDAGSIASLNYGFKLVQLPVGIFVTALATAVYPRLSECAANKDKVGFGVAVASSIRMLALLLIPASVGMVVLRYPIVKLVFERGSFDNLATAQTGIALGFYAVGLMGVAGVQILIRGFYSLQDSVTPVKIAVATAVVNILLALVLVRTMGHGGLALANSIGMLFNASVLLYMLRRHVEPGTLDFAPLLVKVLLASLAMGAVSSVTHRVLASLGQVISLGAAVAVGLAVYGLILLMLRVDEVSSVIQLGVNRLRKLRGLAT